MLFFVKLTKLINKTTNNTTKVVEDFPCPALKDKNKRPSYISL